MSSAFRLLLALWYLKLLRVLLLSFSLSPPSARNWHQNLIWINLPRLNLERWYNRGEKIDVLPNAAISQYKTGNTIDFVLSGHLWCGARDRVRWSVLHPLHPLPGSHAGVGLPQPRRPASLGRPHPLQPGRRSVVCPCVDEAVLCVMCRVLCGERESWLQLDNTHQKMSALCFIRCFLPGVQIWLLVFVCAFRTF